MSSIQTPAVNINPNVELVNRQAPNIVYQPEPYVPETYFDYEQLSNVLGAGVQAAESFAKRSLIDLEIEQNALKDSIKQRNDQFRVGFYEAERKDRESKIDGQSPYSYRKAYLKEWEGELGSLGVEEQKIYNDAYGDVAEADVAEAYKFNSNLITNSVRGTVARVIGLADGGDLAMMGVLANIDTQDKALEFIKSQMPRADRDRLNSMTSYDRAEVQAGLAEVMSSLVARGQKIRAGRAASENQLKNEEAARNMGIKLAGDLLTPVSVPTEFGPSIGIKSAADVEGHIVETIKQTRAGLLAVNPTAQMSEIDTAVNQTIEVAVQQAIENGNSSHLAALNEALASPAVTMDGTRKMELGSRINTAIDRRMNEEVNTPMMMFQQSGNLAGLEVLKDSVMDNDLYMERFSPDGTQKMAMVFVARIEEAQKTVMRANRSRGQTGIRDELVKTMRKRGRVSEADLQQYESELRELYTQTRYVPQMAAEGPSTSYLTGDPLDIENPLTPDELAIAKEVDEMRKRNASMIASGVQVKLDEAIAAAQQMIDDDLRQGIRPESIRINDIVNDANIALPTVGASEEDRTRFFAELGTHLRGNLFPKIDKAILDDVNRHLLKTHGVEDDKGTPKFTVSSLDGEITPSPLTKKAGTVPTPTDIEYLKTAMLESMRFRWEWNGRTSDKADINNLRAQIVGLNTSMIMDKMPNAVIQAMSLYRESRQYGITPEMMFGTDENGKKIAKVVELASQFETTGGPAGLLEAFRDAWLTVGNDPRYSGYNRFSFGPETNLTAVQQWLPDFIANHYDVGVPSDAKMYGMTYFTRRVAQKLQEGIEITTAMNEAEKEFKRDTVTVRGVALPANEINSMLQGPTAAEAFVDLLTGGEDDVVMVWLDSDAMGNNLYGLRTKAGTTYVPKERVITFKDPDLGQDRKVIIPSTGVFTLNEMIPQDGLSKAAIFREITVLIPTIVKNRKDRELKKAKPFMYFPTGQ